MATVESKVKAYLLENTDEIRQIVSELNSWNGCLESLEVYEFDESFFEMMFPNKPMEAVRAWHYGSDDNSWGDEYIRFDGRGNLETLSEYTYEQELIDNIDDIVENLIGNQSHVSVSDELERILADERRYAIDYRNMRTAIHGLIVFDSEDTALEALESLKEAIASEDQEKYEGVLETLLDECDEHIEEIDFNDIEDQEYENDDETIEIVNDTAIDLYQL